MDEDSGSDSENTDKYTSFQTSHVQYATSKHTSDALNGKHLPIVMARSIDDNSVQHRGPARSKPIVVQGQPIYHKPSLQDFSPRKEVSETGSEATTAITAHTLRPSPHTGPKRRLPQSPRDLLRNVILPPQPPPDGAPPRRIDLRRFEA